MSQEYRARLEESKRALQEFQRKVRREVFERKIKGEPNGDTFTSRYFTPEDCTHGYTFGRELGSGIVSSAYVACKADDCGYIIKVTNLYSVRERAEWVKEVKISEEMGKLGIGPKVIDYWICEEVFASDFWNEERFPGENLEGKRLSYEDSKTYYEVGNIGIIVMEKVNYGFEEWFIGQATKMSPAEYEEFKKTILAVIEKKMRTMYDATGKIHDDLFPDNNVMVQPRPDGTDEILFIDFGAEGLKRGNEEELNRVIDRTKKYFSDFFWSVQRKMPMRH